MLIQYDAWNVVDSVANDCLFVANSECTFSAATQRSISFLSMIAMNGYIGMLTEQNIRSGGFGTL